MTVDICDRCEEAREIVYAGPLPLTHALGWGKFCAPCWAIVQTPAGGTDANP